MFAGLHNHSPLLTMIWPRSKASRANMLTLRTSNFQGQLSDRASSKTMLIYYHFFKCKPWKLNVKFNKETDKNPVNAISIAYFLSDGLIAYKTFSRTVFSDGHHGLIDSPLANTITSRGQFKPIKIRGLCPLQLSRDRNLELIAINLPEFYQEYRSLIGCATHCSVVDSE